MYDRHRLLPARCGRHRCSSVGVLFALPLGERLDVSALARSDHHRTRLSDGVTGSILFMAARRPGHGQGSIVMSDDAHDGGYPFRCASKLLASVEPAAPPAAQVVPREAGGTVVTRGDVSV